MLNRISNFATSALCYFYSLPGKDFPRFFYTEQTEQIFNTVPLYSRIIDYIELEDLHALRKANPRGKGIESLSLAIDAGKKKKLNKLLFIPKAVENEKWQQCYQRFKTGDWRLQYKSAKEPDSPAPLYITPPNIATVYSFHSWSDRDSYGVDMAGVLSDGNVFNLYGEQSTFTAARLVATMTVFPSWHDLIMAFSLEELVSFINNMKANHLTLLAKKLKKSKGHATELTLKKNIVKSFKSTLPKQVLPPENSQQNPQAENG